MKNLDRIRNQLVQFFDQYKTDNLRGISAKQLQNQLESRIGIIDAESENYSDDELSYQRDLTVKFHWGHNHDFGDFRLQGRMADRHIDVMATFLDMFKMAADDFVGAKVFDIGCWTGGTTLLLAAMQCKHIVAVEEVNKYADTTQLLVNSFGLSEQVEVVSKSLYACNVSSLRRRFDIVHFPGVIYHLSDPVLALRIAFNSLKVGGKILIESEGIDHAEPYCRFDGAFIVTQGNEEEMNRGGWNWFLPSPSALERMMREVGFENIDTRMHDNSRVYGYAEKLAEHGICKAGLSVSDIP